MIARDSFERTRGHVDLTGQAEREDDEAEQDAHRRKLHDAASTNGRAGRGSTQR